MAGGLKSVNLSVVSSAKNAKLRRIFEEGGVRAVARTIARRGIRAPRLFWHLSKADLLHGRRVLHVDDSTFEVPDDMAWAFRDGSYYERNVEHWIKRILRSINAPVFYDIGANYGYYTIAMASIAETVYAFEPTSTTFAVLARNVERNHMTNVTILPLALGEARGVARMTLYSSSGNNSLIARTNDAVAHLEVHGYEEVQTEPLDQLFRERRLAPPSLIKIDTEGSEVSVLRGARELLSTHHPFVVMEYDASSTQDAGHSLAELRDELYRHAYTLYGLNNALEGDRHDTSLHSVDDNPRAVGTLMAMPPSRQLEIRA